MALRVAAGSHAPVTGLSVPSARRSLCVSAASDPGAVIAGARPNSSGTGAG